MARVVGEIAQQGERHTYGMAFVDEKLDFWKIEFPPAPEWDERPLVLTLECGGCREEVDLVNGDFEYDICAIHGGLTRYCEECGMLTVWRRSTEMRTVPRAKSGGKKVAVVGAPTEEKRAVQEAGAVILPIAEPAAAKEVERQLRVRAKVNFFACVRSEKFEEEIVTCIDMSRGGVSFKSRNCYMKGMKIQIAVPFAAEAREAPAIFVQGRITNVKEIASQGMYRCGVEFVR